MANIKNIYFFFFYNFNPRNLKAYQQYISSIFESEKKTFFLKADIQELIFFLNFFYFIQQMRYLAIWTQLKHNITSTTVQDKIRVHTIQIYHLVVYGI